MKKTSSNLQVLVVLLLGAALAGGCNLGGKKCGKKGAAGAAAAKSGASRSCSEGGLPAKAPASAKSLAKLQRDMTEGEGLDASAEGAAQKAREAFDGDSAAREQLDEAASGGAAGAVRGAEGDPEKFKRLHMSEPRRIKVSGDEPPLPQTRDSSTCPGGKCSAKSRFRFPL